MVRERREEGEGTRTERGMKRECGEVADEEGRREVKNDMKRVGKFKVRESRR